MDFIATAHTDVGNEKKINQDSFFIKIAKTTKGNVLFAAVADGMGGLSSGELASATLVKKLSDWFAYTLSGRLNYVNQPSDLRDDIKRLIDQCNTLIYRYGIKKNISLGSTLTLLLAFGGRYLIAHVGDSRAYMLTDGIQQLTHDQSLVARELAMGVITAEQAKKDSRKNILLQCMGESAEVEPEFLSGAVARGSAFMLCSDGFVHELSEAELYGTLSPAINNDERRIKNNLTGLVGIVKSRRERDNITVLYIKTI